MIGIATGCHSDSMQIAGGSMAGKNNSCFPRGMSDWLQVAWLLTFRAEGGGTPSGVGIRACAWRRLIRSISEPAIRVSHRMKHSKGTERVFPNSRTELESWTLRNGKNSEDWARSLTEPRNERWQQDNGRQAREGRGGLLILISFSTASPSLKTCELVEWGKTEKRKQRNTETERKNEIGSRN